MGTSTGWWTAQSRRVRALSEEPKGGNNTNGNNIGKWEWDRGERRRLEPYSIRGDDHQPRLAAHCLARTSYTVTLHTLHTCSRALTYLADHAGSCTAQITQENAAASEGAQVDR